MKYILYIVRFIHRIRLWLIGLPLLAACYMIWRTQNPERIYNVHTTIYTGVVSGYDVGEGQEVDWNTKNGTIVNMIDLITSEATLRRVSMRLYARCLLNGNTEKDNIYINASTYRWLLDHTPKQVLDLVVPGDEDKTVENFLSNMTPNNTDHLYGLFMWEDSRYFGNQELSQIQVERVSSSDMLKINYQNNDPGVTYNTLLILIQEFFDQYQQMRYGETNNAIEYFRKELAEAEKKLKTAEEELTAYNIDKKVINYTDETKEVAAINKEFELNYQDVLMSYAKSQAAVETLEGRINSNIQNLRNNASFLEKLNRISELQAQITNIDAFGQKSDENREKISALKRELTQEEKNVTMLTQGITEGKYSQEGIVNKDFITEWLMQTLELSKAKAQKEVMERWREELDKKYVYYAPIGSTLKSKEREIDFTERTYLSLQEGLNATVLRLRQLQMTTNTLKVTDEPSYPISPLPHQRKMMVLLTFFCVGVFVLAYFLLLELVDRTLRDRIRAERITEGTVIGVMPADSRRYRPFSQQAKLIAAQFLAKAIVPYFGTKRPIVINLLSAEEGDGKHFVAHMLYDYWTNLGVRVKICSYRTDFKNENGAYLLANQLSDFCSHDGADLFLVVYQPLNDGALPTSLLQEASLNLMVARSNRTWKNIDQEAFVRATLQSGEVPLLLVLNQTGWEITEDMTGLLPPHTTLRRLLYRLSQFGFTGSDRKVKTQNTDNQASA